VTVLGWGPADDTPQLAAPAASAAACAFRDKPRLISDGEKMAALYNIACCHAQLQDARSGLVALSGGRHLDLQCSSSRKSGWCSCLLGSLMPCACSCLVKHLSGMKLLQYCLQWCQHLACCRHMHTAAYAHSVAQAAVVSLRIEWSYGGHLCKTGPIAM
jgi:hypothetical protein